MDAFYASVEWLRYPQLKDLPMVVGAGHGLLEARLERLRAEQPGRAWDAADRAQIPLAAFPRLSDYVGRGVITTASYAARKFGIGSAMGLMKAARLCPQAILLPVDFTEYRKYSRAFKRVILQHAPLMEDRGIDEVYIDFTEAPDGQAEGGRVLAERLQRGILEATGLSCSIGVAPNKLLAKMASEFNKPGGISIVHEQDLQALIWPLPCRKINGVGPKTDARLQQHGIRTIGELAACDPAWLVQRFGPSHGGWLHDAAWGHDERPVVTESEPVSMSRETTFERDLHAVHDRAELGAIFTELAEEVADDLQRAGYVGRTIGVKLRFADFRIVTRDQTVAAYTSDARRIRQVAGQCLKRVDLTQRLRLLGVRVGSLMREADAPADLPARKAEPDLPLFEPLTPTTTP
ncbi:MAG TPA: DNA polymerase IV [Ottowia sp.]|uniref:DNA polymerase IV n=1 Tax=Ottowia sp. TaxID=1898956 RepID=UPI002BE41D8B|nr:DNA polymerase IV [Ottowia sp.]HMN21575.1 DNA polymerase IV [Ottowia sp.]